MDMKGFGILMIAACLFTAVACSKEDTEDVRSKMDDIRGGSSRSAALNDSSDTDSGKVRIGDVVIDTTWNGDTIIHF